MKKTIRISIAIVVGFFVFANATLAVSAASLKFGQTSYTGAVGSTFTVEVKVDPGTDSISGVDAFIVYDSALLEAQSVAHGTYFPTVYETITPGKVSIYSSEDETDPTGSETGEGTIATITFKALKNGGGTIQYLCDNSNNTSKIIKSDINFTNIIVCAQNGSTTVTAGTGSSTATTVTPVPTTAATSYITPTPVTQLPVTGTKENMMFATIMGIALIVSGGAVKLLLKN